jgi:hypothetical protein
MSSAIKWAIPAGSLGTIPENIAYNKNLEATASTNITYSHHIWEFTTGVII